MFTGATAFGALPILVKLAYSAGLGLEELLAYRFLFAAPCLFAIALIVRQNPLRIDGRRLLTLFAMGAIGLSVGSLALFAALKTLPASLAELVFYTHPALVVLAGWIIFGRRVTRRHYAALAASLIGVVLLVDIQLHVGPGIVLAAGAALAYTTYLLVGECVMPGTPGFAAAAIITCGAALTWLLIALVGGHLRPPQTVSAWTVLIAMVLVPTLVGISSMLAALPRIGAARVSVVGTWEPVVTIAIAVMVLGEHLAPPQVAGAALVIVAVVTLQWPIQRDRRVPPTAAHP